MISKGYFVYAGESSEDYGIYTAGSGTFNSPERDIEEVVIPGRNGTLTIDNGRFSNVNVVFTSLLKGNFSEKSERIKAWILSKTGYQRLEDSFSPDYFRLARPSGSISWTLGEMLRYGYADLTFSCRPERFLKIGETPVEFTSAGTIENPTLFTSKPLVRVYCEGNGSVTIGNQIITLSDIDEFVDIDSELQNCSKNGLNRNNKVALEYFPEFAPGENGIDFSGNVTSVEVSGRWWTL